MLFLNSLDMHILLLSCNKFAEYFSIVAIRYITAVKKWKCLFWDMYVRTYVRTVYFLELSTPLLDLGLVIFFKENESYFLLVQKYPLSLQLRD
jgi:hypothetical protein